MSKREIDKWRFSQYLNWWRSRLFRSYISAYVWGGSLADSLPPYTIERMLYNNGCIALVNLDTPIFAQAAPYGQTNYADLYNYLTYTTPITSGEAVIQSTAAFGGQRDQNSITTKGELLYSNVNRQPGKEIVSRYANLLAHADLTLRSYLVNLRATGIIAADNEVTGAAVNRWYDGLLDGDLMCVVDKDQLASLIGSQGLRTLSMTYPSANAVKEIVGCIIQLMRSFYAEVGIKVAPEKKEREIVAEVEADDIYLDYNLAGGLELRQDFCERAKKYLDINISVETFNSVYARKQRKEETNDSGIGDMQRSG